MPENQDIERAAEALRAEPRILPLTGKVQHYDWGGFTFIPDLLGEQNLEHKPYAELWIGAHTSAPSIVALNEQAIPLNDLQEYAADVLLGENVAARYGDRLPYLYKVLDAHKMLSIQAHPTKQQAEEGFRRENEAGIDLKASDRNYKDDNHKPEVHVALTEFWMLHSFRTLEEIARTLTAVPELSALMPDFGDRLGQASSDVDRRELLRALYERAMTMHQDDVDAILNPLLARLQGQGAATKDSADYWAMRAAVSFPLPDGHRDRGIFSIYLLNLVHLEPGQGTYQPAGCLHAYLEGVNMELMANSDNVLRGGLTPKHVDVPELMRTLTFETGYPNVLTGETTTKGETVYGTPASEFELSRLSLDAGQRVEHDAGHGPDALIVLDGSARITSDSGALDLSRGQIAFAADALGYAVEATGGPATLFRASVPSTD